MRGSIQHIPWIGKLLILLGMYLIGEYTFALVTVEIINAIYPGINFLQFITSFDTINSVDEITLQQERALKIYQFGTSLGRFILVALLYIYLTGENVITSLSLNKSIKQINYITILLIVFASGAIISVVYEWNQNLHLPKGSAELEATMRSFEQQAKIQTEVFLRTTVFAGLLVNLLIVGLLAAVGEEIFFRGVLQNLFFRWTKNPHIAIWIAAFIFSFIHLQFYGFVPRLLMGALMGYLYYYSGSLWSAIVAHFINNSVTVIGYYFLNKGWITTNIAETSNLWAALIAVPFLILLMRYFMRTETSLSIADGKRLDVGVLDSGQDESDVH